MKQEDCCEFRLSLDYMLSVDQPGLHTTKSYLRKSRKTKTGISMGAGKGCHPSLEPSTSQSSEFIRFLKTLSLLIPQVCAQ